MTAAVASSPFFDFEVMNKNNKLLNYNNNNLGSAHPLSGPCTGTAHIMPPVICSPSPTTLLDRKAVGTPSVGAGGVYQRRHSVSSTKFNQNQFLNSLKVAPDHSSLICSLGGGGGSNKENRGLRDRSFSETGERGLLLQQQQQQQPQQQPQHKCLGGGPASPTGTSQVNSSRYKTELCRPFEENGACKYGDKCQFAHGIHELRSLSRHPKYKTELCRTFHTIGFCPYGPRCHFIHNAEERRGPPPSSSPLSALSLSLSSSSSNNKMEQQQRPRLQHSYSFAGFPSHHQGGGGGLGRRGGGGGGMMGDDSPTSVTPPPMFFPDEIPVEWPSSNPFTYSSQELANLFGPSLCGGGGTGGGGHLGAGDTEPASAAALLLLAPPSPTGGGAPYFFRPMLESPRGGLLFESSPSGAASHHPDSISDQEGYQSSSGGSLSGSESPTLDTTRRLPIFSRLSISDD